MSGGEVGLLAQWITWQYAQSLSARTVEERVATVGRMARWAGVEPHLVDMDQIVAWLAEAGEWAASSRHTYHSQLRAWFGWLQRMGYRGDDPMLNVGTPRRPRGKPHPVATEHMPLLLATRMHKRTRVMILLAALAGLRVHEIAKFRGEHVDIIGRTITVVGKGGVKEVLPLHPLLLEVAYTMPRRGWWFPTNSTRTGHVLARSVSGIISRAMERAGIPGSAHSLRHWYGTTLVRRDTDLRTAQKLLRHASLATTQIYVDVADDRKVEAVHRLDPWAAA